ncbi:hypothetical protein A5761_27980 [Mycolicibacterium setense]|uniref:HNH endonuclease signature motif containing protein n=1 Tax=Mycolicibacterium setense TaxID=431269 RepID=UPI0007EBA5EE|nr:HNH endonuclease signature motif containing protein [Mycolicibacterium setense]OBB10243.1 hypothetical protein A5761_27980 [Mycolicibacterium setense]
MTTAAAPAALPTRSEIEEWSTSHLSDAASNWRTAATASEGAFDQHRQNISSPGGTTWTGDAKDAALDRVTKDVAVVGRQGGVLREAAALAQNGSYDIKAAKDKAVEAITAAENDGFTVGEDLSVIDSREYDINTIAERNRALAEHAEDIRWAAEQLAQADNLVGTRLQSKAAELEGIPFDGEGRDGEPTVQLVDNKVQDKPSDDGKGEKPGAAPGQIGPFAVPKSVEDAAKKDGLKPEEKPPAPVPDDSGLGDLLGVNDHAEHKPGEEKHAGLPPALSQLPPAPDKATIDQQRARVDAARQNLAAAETKQKDAAGAGYVLGAGSGPSPDETKALTQAVFDARRELTEQTDALRELSAASVANGGPVVPVPALPLDADKQAFPPPPSISDTLADANHQLSENTFGLIPDVAKDIDTLNNWGTASGADKLQAGLDAAGLLPLPGAKFLGEGFEHGLDALGGVAHHVDDAPTPHVDAPSSGHAPVDPPVEHHSSPDAPVEHHAHGDGDHHDVDVTGDSVYQPDGAYDAPMEPPRPYNNDIEAYPRAYHPGTGEEMPFPSGDLERIPKDLRSEWTKMDRYYYIQQWHDMGYETPPGGWSLYDIHHIKPREFGGDNSFENLIPVPRPLHGERITPWWNNFG